jgi:hypothetical protein
VTANVTGAKAHVAEYEKLIEALRSEITDLRSKLGAPSRLSTSNIPLNLDDSYIEDELSTPINSAHLEGLAARPLSFTEHFKSDDDAPGRRPTLVKEELDKEKATIKNMFHECIALRRNLMEIEEANARCELNLKERWGLIGDWVLRITSESVGGDGVAKDKMESDLAYDAAWKQRDEQSWNEIFGPVSEDMERTGPAALLAETISSDAPLEVQEAWSECLDFRKAIAENNEEKAARSDQLRDFEQLLWELHDDLRMKREATRSEMLE